MCQPSNFLRDLLNARTIKRGMDFWISISSTTVIWIKQIFNAVDIKLWLRMCITNYLEFPRNTEQRICPRKLSSWKYLSVQYIVIKRYILWIKVVLNLATTVPIKWQDQIWYLVVCFTFYLLPFSFCFIIYIFLTLLWERKLNSN